MKILLTGQPRSGKTTILSNMLANNILEKRGFFTQEVRENGERIGFDAVDEKRREKLARTNFKSKNKVGSYFVNAQALDEFINPLFKFKSTDLLFIDEIGQMQLNSLHFEQLVQLYLSADNDFVGTITSNFDNKFIKSIKEQSNILIFGVTPRNRSKIEACLSCTFEYRHKFNNLNPELQLMVIKMASKYLQNDEYIQFQKLFKNAVTYISGGRVRREGKNFLVKGNTSTHRVVLTKGHIECDCNLFNGVGDYTGQGGECSHIQASLLHEI